MIQYKRVTLSEFLSTAGHILEDNLKEAGELRNEPTPDIDLDFYQSLENAGVLYCYVFYNEEEIVGILVGFVYPNYQRVGTQSFRVDTVYTIPKYRGTSVTLRIFSTLEKECRSMMEGISSIFCASPYYHQHSKLFSAMEYEPKEVTYEKVF